MKDLYRNYGPLFMLILLTYLSFVMFRPYLMTMLGALIIAYLFYPLYKVARKAIRYDWLASLLICVLVLLIITIPVFYVVNVLIKEIPSVYIWLSGYASDTGTLVSLYQNILSSVGVESNFNGVIDGFISSLLENLRAILTSVPGRILNFTLAILFLFFFFKDGDVLVNSIRAYLPFGKAKSQILIGEVKNTMDAVIYGQVVTAILQAILATAAYYVLGLRVPLFFGLLTLVFSVIPMVGPAFAYIPISITMIVVPLISSGSTAGVFRGLALLAFGIGVISMVDNVVKPVVISGKVNVHPVLIILGIVGGITTFGIIGVVLGPVILSIMTALLKIYKIDSA
ncbi:TPA: AI-2E family transporter [Candidatus Woesearchaeota archaeon]|nr:AI-2E family transporter [Candidatus Woesearchaeota archaeon]HIH40786.1 AI-2E family transporter [Candidatus Woesearchaeota archaeon]